MVQYQIPSWSNIFFIETRSIWRPKYIKVKQIGNKLINKISPDEIYYLSGQSSVRNSFKDPFNTYLSNNLTLFYILENARKINPNIKIYNSASSECFGNNKKIYCDEKTVFNPVSPYGRAKTFGFWLTKYYREMFDIKVSNGILFNHESPLRTKHFVTQKIVNYARNYKRGDKTIWAYDFREIHGDGALLCPRGILHFV